MIGVKAESAWLMLNRGSLGRSGPIRLKPKTLLDTTMISLLRPDLTTSNTLEQWLRDYLSSDDPFSIPRRTPALPADVYEDAEAFHALLELPGVSKEKLEVTLENSVLRISGKYNPRPGDQGTVYEFSRSLSVPDGVDAAGVTAELRDGILHLRLPKHEERKPRNIQIA
jgi:HSP20 family protein